MQHPNFNNAFVTDSKKYIELVNAFYDGVNTANDYLIQYENETSDGLKKRKKLSRLSNYVRDYTDTIASLVMRNKIDTVEYDKTPLAEYFNSIDMIHNLDIFARTTLENLTKDGITYLLIEKKEQPEGLNKAEAVAYRPYFVNIKRSSVKNFKQADDGSFLQFTYDEPYVIDKGYSTEEGVQQRCYIMRDGVCEVEIWRDDKLFDTKVNPIGFIPIIQVGDEVIPKAYDLAVLNKNHFNLKSEQRFYVRRCANPQMVSYHLDSDSEIKLGADKILNFNIDKNQAGFEFKELTGTSTEALQKLIDNDEIDMKKYIVGLVESDIQRTAKEVSLSNSNNEATLNLYADMIEEALNNGLFIIGLYQDFDASELRIYINREFIDNKLLPEEVTQLLNLYTQGVIDWSKLVESLRDGKVLFFKDMQEIELMKNKLVLGA